jgi:hypothetical protein
MRISARAVGSSVLLAALAAVLLVPGCGVDVERSKTQKGRTYGTEAWYEVAFGSSRDEITVRFEGPRAGGDDDCEPEREVLVEPEPTLLRVTVKRYSPSPVVTCPIGVQTMTAKLPEALGDRVLVNPATGWRFRPSGDRFVLDPESTPCGREDCSQPAVAKASCNPFEFAAVVNEQIRPAAGQDADVRCDGSFLILTRAGRRAFFVNREAAWKLVTVDARECEAVFRQTRVRFPEALCR